MRILNKDTRTVARMKMLYLVPLNLILLLPAALWVGLDELIPDFIYSIKSAWKHEQRI